MLKMDVRWDDFKLIAGDFIIAKIVEPSEYTGFQIIVNGLPVYALHKIRLYGSESEAREALEVLLGIRDDHPR